MKKTINFGKIDFFKIGKNINDVDVDIELIEKNGHYEFSVCASVWNEKLNDIVNGGQIIDTLLPYFKDNELYNEIYSLWKEYHLNGLKAGTHKQNKIIDDYFEDSGERFDYDTACEVLKKHHKYFDKLAENEYISCGDLDRNHYAYGTGWLLWDIPSKDLKRIKELFKY